MIYLFSLYKTISPSDYFRNKSREYPGFAGSNVYWLQAGLSFAAFGITDLCLPAYPKLEYLYWRNNSFATQPEY